MLHLGVCLHCVSGGEDLVTEGAADVSLLHVVHELLSRREANSVLGIVGEAVVALVTPVLEIGMLLFDMASQRRGRVEASATSGILTDKAGHLEMLGANVALQSLVLAERLVAGGVLAAAKAFLSLVDELVASKTGAGQKALSALGFLADMLAFSGVGSAEMLLQVLLLEVRLVASIVGAHEGSLALVGS